MARLGKNNLFRSWRERVISPLVYYGILGAAIDLALGAYLRFSLSFAEALVIFVVSDLLLALAVWRVLMRLLPMQPGRYSARSNPAGWYAWSLRGLLQITHLSILIHTGVIPPFFRKRLYQLLGGRFAPGVLVIGGLILEPELVRIESEVVLGLDSALIGHCLTETKADPTLIIGEIHIGRGAMVGARTIVWPDVVIGEGAVVQSNSVVVPGTRIGPGEVWGGTPARKVREAQAPRISRRIARTRAAGS